MKVLGLIETPDDLVTKEYVDKKSDEIKTAGYITKDTADEAYQTKGDYATKDSVDSALTEVSNCTKQIDSLPKTYLTIENAKNEYTTKDEVKKIKIDHEGYVRFNAANLFFSTMLLAKMQSVGIEVPIGVWQEFYINDRGSLVKMTDKYSTSIEKDIWKLIKNERYLYLPADDYNFDWFMELLEDKIIGVPW